ncbi:MAG: hypothetical protein ACK4MV_10425 [Beijerinckiaceae bacterium]
MIRAYVAFLVLVSSGVALYSLLRVLPFAVMIALPLCAGLFCLALGSAILWAALSVPTDREAGLLIALSLLSLAALNLGAAARVLIRRR